MLREILSYNLELILSQCFPVMPNVQLLSLNKGDELDKSEMEFMNRRSRVQHLGLPVTFDKTKQLYFQWKWLDWDFFGHSHVQWYHNGDTELAPAIAIEPVTDKISGYYQKVSISHASILEDGVLTGHLQINATGYLTKHNCLATLSSELQYLTMDTVNLEIQYYGKHLCVVLFTMCVVHSCVINCFYGNGTYEPKNVMIQNYVL